MVHMQRYGEHIVTIVEPGLRAVTVMDVPAYDRYAPHSRCPSVLGNDGDVIDETIAVRVSRPA
jgi:hypothetical protein